MACVPGVLLGVAEVKVPVKRFPQEMLIRVADVAGWAVVHDGHKDSDKNDIFEDRIKFIGEVDKFYAFREVEVRVEDGECHIMHGDHTVLQHRVKDVATITPTNKQLLRVVYISKSETFGRAAVVLQMKTQHMMEQLLALFPAAERPGVPDLGSNGAQPPSNKESKASLGRSMGKRLTNILMASLATGAALATGSPVKSSPQPVRKPIKTPERSDLVDSDTDSDSEEEDSVGDDTDSKSTGAYYEDMGFDPNVQERLYDVQTADTVSRSSDTSLETNALIIEAELKFFLETDSEFLRTLQSLGEDRERLTRGDTPQYLREKVILLFSQVKALTDLHSELHAEFENSDGNLQSLSNAIIKRHKEYEKYVYFMENIPVVDSILKTHKDYMKEHMPNLPEKLRKPRMRLHYYVLTLETLLKKSSCPVDKEALQKAIDVLKVPLKKADSKLFLGAVTGAPFDLGNFGDLLRHSDLTLRRGGDLPRRVYHVLMLKTLILLTLRNGRNYTYVTSFRMDQVGLGSQDRGLIFDLKVRNGPRGQAVLYIFKAKNINLQQQWINDLKSIMKDKSLPNTPRNSYIEVDSDIRYSSKRPSRVTRGQSVERLMSNVSGASTTGSIVADESDRALLPESNEMRSVRRGAIKKHSSTTAKGHSMLRQQSGYSSDGEGSWSKRKMTDQLSPLCVWTCDPYLKDFYYHNCDKPLPFHIPDSLVDEEKEYIESLRNIFGGILNNELPRFSQCGNALLRHIFEFHENVFLPLLEKASSRRENAQCFVDCSEKLRELYSYYFVELTRLHDQLQFHYFQLPMEHFVFYTKELHKYERQEEDVIPPVQMALSTLRECLSDANALLLTESVKEAPFDLGEHAPVLYEGPAKVRWTGMMMRQEMHLVLLDTMLLLLEPHLTFYYYVDALRMDTVWLEPVSDKLSFQLKVRTADNKTMLYAFRTPCVEDRDKWLREITNILGLQVKRLKEKQMKRLGTTQGELVTVGDSNTPLYSDIRPLETAL